MPAASATDLPELIRAAALASARRAVAGIARGLPVGLDPEQLAQDLARTSIADWQERGALRRRGHLVVVQDLARGKPRPVVFSEGVGR